MHLFAVMAIRIILSDPVTEAADALKHAATLPTAEARYTRYFSMYNAPIGDRDASAKTMRFWVNSLSTRHRMAFPRQATDSLWSIDLRDYGWTDKIWEDLAKSDPYFGVFDSGLYSLTGSYYGVMRWDYFLAATSADPTYGKFLGLPNTLAELKKQFFVQEEGVKGLGLAQGGAVLQSIVALHNRQLERWPTITGAFWQSRDVKDNREKHNVLEPDNLFAIEFDGAEFIWSLPNGLHAYFLVNAQQKQVNVVPPDIAIDTVSPFRDKQVRSARSCVSCHGKGINPFDDVISKLIRATKPNGQPFIDLVSLDKEIADALEDFYLSDLGRSIKHDQAEYAAAVQRTNRTAPEENAAVYAQAIAAYLDDQVTLLDAAAELGVSKEWFDQIKAASGTVTALIAGNSDPDPDKRYGIARDAWEDQFSSLLKLKYELRKAKKGEENQ